MRSEIKAAIVMGAVIAIAVTGISLYFETFDRPSPDVTLYDIDKTGFKKAPELNGISGYINTDPQTLKDQIKDKVVLYDIWTYSCINCQRTLPYITAWHNKYAEQGLLIVGIHSPEFEFEKDIKNVELASEKFGIKYPVILDNDKKIWDAFENRYWPRKYIADDQGYIRYDHIGEGAYEETEKIIQQLLAERAIRLGLEKAPVQPLVNIEQFEYSSKTPELYFGYDFAFGRSHIGNSEGFQPEKEITYTIPDKLDEDNFYLDGTWRNLSDRMMLTSDNGRIILPYYAKEVNIVASGPAELRVFLDGKQITPENSGRDVRESTISTAEATLYNVVRADKSDAHVIEIQVNGHGFEIYTFTFG